MWRAMTLLITLNAFSANTGSINPEEKVRPPAVAGAFYPADPSELARMVDEFLSQASVPAVKQRFLSEGPLNCFSENASRTT